MKTQKILAFIVIIALLTALVAGCSDDTGGGDVNADVSASPQSDASPNPDTDGDDENPVTSGYEEGTSPTDDIVLTTPADKVLLVVSFGTSYNQSRNLTIGGVETALQEAFPDYQVRRAFTSQIIIDKLASRDGLQIDNIEEAMTRLVLDKVKEVVIQPTHVMSGFEYDDVIEAIMPYADKFESFKVGKPLLIDDIDYDEVAEIIVQETSAYRADDTAVVFMGHGTEHAANATYTKLQNVLIEKGYSDYLIGTVEAEPTLDEVREQLEAMNVTKVVLHPLMVVAGDHANNDMAGDEEDSWKTVLTEDGYAVESLLNGLGQLRGIQEIYIRHVEDAIASSDMSVTPAATLSGVTGRNIADGTYDITVTSSTSMFKIVECELTVENGGMTAVMTLSGQGFAGVYLGTGEQAVADTENGYIGFTLVDERHEFIVPVEALDRELECSGLSAKKGTWYDHIVVFESDGIPAAAFVPGEIDVALSGGTGKASVDSPAKLTYIDKQLYAEIVWSSPNYSYMTIDGVQYLPVNTEGNSTFVIPIVVGADMDVVACTTAMSTPREIEYVLRFDYGADS